MRRLGLALLALATFAGAHPSAAPASWAGIAPAGSVTARALTMPAGNVPTTSVSGRNVTVAWNPSLIAGRAADGYVVRRYDSGGQAQAVGSGCSGVVSATTCTESVVPAGSWTYKVAPKLGNWQGAESASSASATVAAASLTFSSSTTVTSLPATLSGDLAGFAAGAIVTYRLDNAATGTVLSGSTTPSPIPASGSASMTVTIPSGTASGSHTVYAVGSDGSTASAAITVSAVACPTAAPAFTWLTGMEMGQSTSPGIWLGGVGSATTLDSAVKRNGAYSYRVAAAGAAQYRTRAAFGVTNPLVVRFALRLAALPSADVELATFVDGAHAATLTSYMALRYKAATQRLAIGFPGQSVESLGQVQAGTWYVIEMRFDPRTNPQTADWRIDGVAQPSTSYASAASYAYTVGFGTTTAATYTANYDDIATSETASDYPLGDGRVLPLRLNGMGTSVGAGNFAHGDGAAIGATSWSRIDKIPMHQANAEADTIKQTVTSSTSYVEMTFADTTEACVRAVIGRMVYEPLNTNQANNGKATIVDGSTERTIFGGSMSASTTNPSLRNAIITPVAPAWTVSTVNALKARIGYSSDASPAPTWVSVLLEYDVPQ